MLESPQPLDPRIERALVHPTRRAILKLLAAGKELRPGAIAEKLDLGAANVAYHVKVLTDCGAVETTKSEHRGERPVRLPGPSPTVGTKGLELSGSRRADVTEAQLKSLIEMASHLRPNRGAGA